MEELLTFLSFNLRRDFFLSPRHPWADRKLLAAKLIQDSGAAIAGVQELSPQMRRDLKALLGSDDYSLVGFGRYGNGRKSSEEHSDLILKNQEVSVRISKTFWLSKNPELRSRAYYAMFPRICTVAEVDIHAIGRSIRVFNTHLDHVCGVARILGVEVILKHMEEMQAQRPMPCVIMGDFNCKPNSKPVRMLKNYILSNRKLSLRDAYDYMPEEERCNTLHNFTGKTNSKGLPIDYIFLTPEFDIRQVKILTDPVQGAYPSDHFPLMVKAALRSLDEETSEAVKEAHV